jgi:pyridoxal 5'-phosphate synthase pdxS subunit
MAVNTDLETMYKGTELIKRGFARMQQGGVIMDVVTPEQAQLAEDAGATAVMALERVPSDIRKDGGVARMSHPDLIRGIIETTSIPVMAKARIGHDMEAAVLQELGVDMVDESEVLTPADPFFHIAKNDFTIPFVCGATNLGEAVRRIHEGAAMIRTKGEAGTGNVVAAVTHSRIIQQEIAQVQAMDDEKLDIAVDIIMDRFYELSEISPLLGDVCTTPFGDLDDEFHADMKNVLLQVKEMGRLPVITFSAGGIATPADAALMMKHGMDGIFVGSGIFKSADPKTTADAIIMATHHFDDPAVVTEASAMMGEAMPGLELEGLATRMEDRGA